MADTRKYDFARLTAAEVESPSPIVRSERIPAASRDCISRRGSAVVLLKHIDGTVQAGNLKAPFKTKPRANDVSVYINAQTRYDFVSKQFVQLDIKQLSLREGLIQN